MGNIAKWHKGTPPLHNEMYSRVSYLVTVINSQVVEMDWRCTSVRGKIVHRWEWNGRLSPWEIIAWAEMPEAYKQEAEPNE